MITLPPMELTSFLKPQLKAIEHEVFFALPQQIQLITIFIPRLTYRMWMSSQTVYKKQKLISAPLEIQ